MADLITAAVTLCHSLYRLFMRWSRHVVVGDNKKHPVTIIFVVWNSTCNDRC